MSLFKNRGSRERSAEPNTAPAMMPDFPAQDSPAQVPRQEAVPTADHGAAPQASEPAYDASAQADPSVKAFMEKSIEPNSSGHRGFASKLGKRQAGNQNNAGGSSRPQKVAQEMSQKMSQTSRSADSAGSSLLTKSTDSNHSTTARYTPPPEFKGVREAVQQFLINQSDAVASAGGAAKVRQLLEPVFKEALDKANLIVSRTERQRMFDLILSDILGYGPIQPLLDDDTITEIMVNSADTIYIEQNGKIQLTNISFMDDNHVLQVIDRIVSPLGRRIDESSPMVDARLPDGSRVNAIIPPLALKGPCITIRKFRADPLTIDDLIEFGSITPEFATFIDACVKARLNIVVSGGTGSGKTTMLNVLSRCIPADDRIVTIEDAAELQLQQPHVISLEKRAANTEGKGEIGIRELVVNSLRMRPDRIVVGECRSGEALDMLQAMNTGHDGSLTTIHSNGARDTLNRTETLVMMAGMDLPLRAIRQQVASAIDMIVHVERMRDGSRKMVQCAEVMGMEGETVVLQDLFLYEQTGVDEDGKLIGSLNSTGLRPRATTRIAEAGITLPADIFGIDPASLWS